MSSKELENLGNIPSPQIDCEVRIALMHKHRMWALLQKYLQEAGYERERTFEEFIETFDVVIPDASFSDVLQNLILYELSISTETIVATTRSSSQIITILGFVFRNFAEGGRYNLENLLTGITESLKKIEEATSSTSKEVPEGLKAYIDKKFQDLESSITKQFTTQQNFLNPTVKQISVWEKLRKELVRDYAANGLKLNRILSEIPDEWAEIIKLIIDLISEEVAEEFALRVVGASYSRWDNSSSYYPTVTFVFKEINVGSRPRSSQIKIRWLKDPNSITDQDISELRRRIETIKTLQYDHGPVRCNYVQNDKSWKTTIFAASRNDAHLVLENLSGILDQTIDLQQFSYTEAQRRTTYTRRNRPIDGMTPETIDYKTRFRVSFYRAVLLINGTPRPIRLYQKPKQEV